jgi:TolB-like protein/AraC-like DNA-binding protein/tetratricopeptide (TPR) repeat protein
MKDHIGSKSVFLQKIVSIVEENIANENFGVTDLAEVVNMSRSNLLRKVKKETGESVSVFIRNVRLDNAKKLLEDETLTVSEIAYQVGFNSTSYFTKCFRERYGHTPGQLGTRIGTQDEVEVPNEAPPPSNSKSKTRVFGLLTFLFVILLGILYWVNRGEKEELESVAKSIAILPFKNNSDDITNEYFMNGLMGAVLENFQKIEDLEISSMASVTRYSGDSKTIPEMSEDLNVSYFVEGSGQKVDNEVLLTIQLIEGASGRQLWSQSYLREIKDVFELQMDVATSIAKEINVIITPEEYKRIEKVPTENLVAYDYYLRGLALLRDETGKGLPESIEQFKKAIQQDGKFANAYAYMAVSYYYLDIYKTEKKYTEEIKEYADKALMLDSDLGESLIAKALYQMQIEEYDEAIASFEEVLAYYPHNSWIHNFLSNIYTNILPNTEKYLEHALQSIHSTVTSGDSSVVSYAYLHLSNALIQTGFFDESAFYVNESLSYNPDNLYSEQLKVFINLAKDSDTDRAIAELSKIHQEDTSRLEVVQDLAKLYYTVKNYEQAWVFYNKLVVAKETLQLDIYQSEDLKIGFVLDQLGKNEEAKAYYESFYDFAENDISLYKDLSYSSYFAALGDVEKGIAHLKAFSETDNYQYWFVLFSRRDPILQQMSSHPEYQATLKKIDDRFWENHQRIRGSLEDEKIISSINSSL